MEHRVYITTTLYEITRDVELDRYETSPVEESVSRLTEILSRVHRGYVLTNSLILYRNLILSGPELRVEVVHNRN